MSRGALPVVSLLLSGARATVTPLRVEPYEARHASACVALQRDAELYGTSDWPAAPTRLPAAGIPARDIERSVAKHYDAVQACYDDARVLSRCTLTRTHLRPDLLRSPQRSTRAVGTVASSAHKN